MLGPRATVSRSSTQAATVAADLIEHMVDAAAARINPAGLDLDGASGLVRVSLDCVPTPAPPQRFEVFPYFSGVRAGVASGAWRSS